MDVIQRIEPVIIELERERECVVVVAHQAVGAGCGGEGVEAVGARCGCDRGAAK